MKMVFLKWMFQIKGYWKPSTNVMNDLTITQSRTPEDMKITNDSKRYLIKIIDYCVKNGIGLTLFVALMYELEPISTEGYDNYYNFVKDIAKEYEIPFYDFNLIKKEYLSLTKTDFINVGHLNERGAKKFTNSFMKVLEYEGNKEDFFYSTFEERMQETDSAFYGIYWKDETDRKVAVLAANQNMPFDFKVSLIGKDEENRKLPEVVLQDWGETGEYIIPNSESGEIIVEWKLKNNSKEIERASFAY